MTFAALVIEQPPLEWSGFIRAMGQWLQDFGLYAFLWLIILGLSYRFYPELRHRVVWGPMHTGMMVLGGLSVIGFVVFLLLLRSQGRIPDLDAPKSLDAATANLPPPLIYTPDEATALSLAGLAAVLACLLPVLRDLFQGRIIARRIWAIAKLSLKEAWSRGIVWVCAIVPLIYLYADWYITSQAEDQLRTRVSIAYFSMAMLFIVTAVLLGAFSIPAEIMNQNIFTIVTKPVERYEIVLGRLFGYSVLIFAELAALSVISCLYIGRGLTDQAKEESYHARVPLFGRELYFHNTVKREEGTNVGREWGYRTYITGINPQLMNQKVQFAIWPFEEIPNSVLTRGPEDELQLEFTFDIFRTTIGQEGKGVFCSFTFARGDLTGEDVDNILKPASPFNKKLNDLFAQRRVPGDDDKNAKIRDDIAWELCKEFGIFQVQGVSVKDYHTQSIPVRAKVFQEFEERFRKFPSDAKDDSGKKMPAMRIMVNVENDRFSRLQLVGMARHDLYLLVEDRDFFVNFFKGSFCIYLLACIVLGLAIICSTYLSGIISLLATTFLCIGGLFLPFVRSIAEGRSNLGGPAQSVYRLFQKTPAAMPLDQQSATVIGMIRADEAYIWVLKLVLNVVPDVGRFSPKDYVANGFDLTWGTLLLLNQVLPMLAYTGPWVLLGYYLIKSREIANP
jgi:ABC-type transport system involved in multi-copper enzyme maturation permease subunit